MFRPVNLFRLVLVALSFGVTGILVLAIGSFFVVADWAEVGHNLLDPTLLASLRLSLWTAASSALLVMLCALPIGLALSRYAFRGRGLVKAVVDLPVAFPELVLGLCLLLCFGKTPVGKWLSAVGLPLVFTKQGVVAAQFFTALPYAIRIMKSTYDFIDPRLEFVSRSLGYSSLQTFWNVTLPMAKSGLVAAGVISFARCLGTFGTVLILAGGSAGKTDTLPIHLYLNISYGNLSLAMTSGMVLIAVAFAAIFLFEKTEARL
ncbi:ABC transporter permease [Desulfohalobium retbaense]|uniref:NifC-like ABC-type porter n=1 Tax=Desulfohalobium retbaense (strain ATCC 49708 / DSM 5692 / JCM 16813 / HR100) TaxID=485915 RepID=C8X3V7_DESRD|nr:ABC transporter permease [Desulfohalobium retbaense]ACV69104.1 NifC-like ABC-type porter [Desulfohalobium retbaense DSM 5692]